MPTHTFRPIFVLLLISLHAAGMVACDGKPRDVPANKPMGNSTPAPSSPTTPPAAKQAEHAAPTPSVAPPVAPSVALKVGDKLPDLTLKDALNQDVRLAALYGKKPIVLTVYRGGWCPYCNINLKQWQDKLQEVTTLGAAIIAVSPESPEHVAETVGKDQLAYTVLSDSTGGAIKALGLAFMVDEKTQSKYKGFGVDLSKHNADGTWELPHPATYVVDTTGVIRYLYVNEDYKKRADIDEVMAAIRQIGAGPGK